MSDIYYEHSEQPSHIRTAGHAPVWGSEFTTKTATLQEGSAEFVPIHCVVGLRPVASRDRVLVHEVSQAQAFAERRRARSADHAGLEVEEHRAGQVLAARGLVLKHVDVAEMRVVVAAVLAVAADAVFAAHHL